MAIAVEFPDGSVRHVPAHLRACPPGARAATPPTFDQVPLNCDSRWRFVHVRGRWLALPRLGGLSILRPSTPAWWADIALMRDNPAETDGAALQTAPAFTPIQESAA